MGPEIDRFKPIIAVFCAMLGGDFGKSAILEELEGFGLSKSLAFNFGVTSRIGVDGLWGPRIHLRDRARR